MRLLLKYLLFILLPAYTYGQSGRPDAGITFEVTDSLHNPLAYATVALTPMSVSYTHLTLPTNREV